MGHDISRITVADFCSVSSAASSELKGARSPTRGRDEHFDVRRAKCTVQEDEDKLMAVIETCGAGAESFNRWMVELLVLAEEKRVKADEL